MLRMIVDKQIIVIALGVFTAAGIISKCMVNTILSRLVRAAGNMNKSTHPLMRLVCAKFEHACMVSDTVENVEVFVDKYLYGYKVFGIRLHSLRRLEKASALLCVVTGLLGAVVTYGIYGMNDLVLQTGVIGVGLGILVYVFHLTTDENYRMQMARNYMVDYLQNVCLHRYEKTRQKEMAESKVIAAAMDEDEFEESELAVEEAAQEPQEPVRPRPGKEVPSPQTPPEILPPVMPEPYPVPDTVAGKDGKDRVRAVSGRAEKEEPEGTEQKSVEREILIRQILEEFMA